jgi:hypothetical protein
MAAFGMTCWVLTFVFCTQIASLPHVEVQFQHMALSKGPAGEPTGGNLSNSDDSGDGQAEALWSGSDDSQNGSCEDDGSSRRRRVLLMLDSGACGADLMLHGRAVRELGLADIGRCALGCAVV